MRKFGLDSRNENTTLDNSQHTYTTFKLHGHVTVVAVAQLPATQIITTGLKKKINMQWGLEHAHLGGIGGACP